MKFAVLSDIHANLPALEAVTADIESWHPDVVVVNGDVINRGPQPAECWAFVQDKIKAADWKLTRGNHEEYVLNHLHDNGDEKSFPMSYWTLNRLKGRIHELQAMQSEWSVSGPEMGEFRATHASMAGSRKGIYPIDPIDKVREYITPAPAVLCVGHIHLPFVRMVDQTLIVNSGSSGQPCYGEKHGCYAQITWGHGEWSAEIRRVPYDRAAMQQAWFDSGILDNTDLMTHIIYHEWRTAKPLVLKWMFEYWPAVKSGDVAESEMLARFLDNEQLGIAKLSDRL